MSRFPTRIVFKSPGQFLLVALLMASKAIYFNVQVGIDLGARFGGAIWPFVYWLAATSLLALLFSRKSGAIWGFLSLGTAAIMQVDLLYFRYFHEFPSAANFVQMAGAASFSGALWSLFTLGDVALYWDLPLLVLTRSRTQADQWFGKLLALSLSVAIIVLFRPSSLFVQVSSLFDGSYHPGMIRDFGPLHYHLQDGIATLRRTFLPSPGIEAADYASVHSYTSAIESQGNAYTGRYSKKNLILIQVESLQGFVLQKTLEGQEITPNLNKLLRSSLFFPNVYHQTGRGRTSDAEFLMQNAMFPRKEGVSFWELKNNHFLSLASALAGYGYQTASMHAFSGTFYNRIQMHKRLGFQQSLFESSFRRDELVGWGIGDKSFLQQAGQAVENLKPPFYCFLITLSSHYPFDGQYRSDIPLGVGRFEGTLLGQYFKAMHYTDEALGAFLDRLQARGLLDDSIVAIYGDHDALPGKNRAELEAFLGTRLDPIDWFNQKRVPFIIHLPSNERRIIPKVGGEIDVAPTLANLMGVKNPNFYWFGSDLLSSGPGRVAFQDGSWIDDKHLFLQSAEGLDRPACFDIKTKKSLPPGDLTYVTDQVQRQLAICSLINSYDLVERLCDRHGRNSTEGFTRRRAKAGS